MPVIRRAFLLGVVSGLRTFTGVSAVSWAARSGGLDLQSTKFAFLGHWLTPLAATTIALGEFVGDTLPITPSRTVPPQFAARVGAGALCGSAVGAANDKLLHGLIAGVAGSVVGTVGGLQVRTALAKAIGHDLPAAMIEDTLAITLALLAISHRATRLGWSNPASASL